MLSVRPDYRPHTVSLDNHANERKARKTAGGITGWPHAPEFNHH